jgi:hypothetical protein
MSVTSSVDSVDAAADRAPRPGGRGATRAVAVTVLVAAAAATGLVAWNRPKRP